MLPPSALALLACPACHATFRDCSPEALACTGCGRMYPIRDGIPVLLVDDRDTPRGNERQETERPAATPFPFRAST